MRRMLAASGTVRNGRRAWIVIWLGGCPLSLQAQQFRQLSDVGEARWRGAGEPSLAGHASGASAGATAGGSPHADAIHHVHARTTCFTNRNQFVRLMKRRKR
jgi:hypothetical protein